MVSFSSLRNFLLVAPGSLKWCHTFHKLSTALHLHVREHYTKLYSCVIAARHVYHDANNEAGRAVSTLKDKDS